MKKMHKRLVICLIVGVFLFSLCSNTQQVVAATQYKYANSYSNNTGWTSPTGAYQDGGAAARCVGSNARIDYGIADPTLEFTSGMFWKCRVEIKWRCFDTGGGGPFRGPLTRGDGRFDKLYVQLYHKTSDSWTSWTSFRHLNSNWEINSLTDSSKLWIPYDLDNLVVRLKHQPSTDPDDIRVDFVRLNADNSESNINWAPYLGSDYARHPTNQEIQDWVENDIPEDPYMTRAEELQSSTKEDWNHTAGGERIEILGHDIAKFLSDTTILSYRQANGTYDFICYHAAVTLSSYFRAESIKSRILYFYSEGKYTSEWTMRHYSTEFWDENSEEWIPADCDDNYGWFGKEDSALIKQKLEPFNWELQNIWVFVQITGEALPANDANPKISSHIVYCLEDLDPDQYEWYQGIFEGI